MKGMNDMATHKTDRQVLEGAMALIAEEGTWTQGTYCRDADGCQLLPSAEAPGEWLRVRMDPVGNGGYAARTEIGATPFSVCLQGALRIAADYWTTRQPQEIHAQVDRLETLLLELANSAAVPGWPTLDSFNDDARTTKADVVLLLKHAVARLESEEHR